jgi:hypothetical protein
MTRHPSLPEPAVRSLAFEAELRLIMARYAEYATHRYVCPVHLAAAAELGRK